MTNMQSLLMAELMRWVTTICVRPFIFSPRRARSLASVMKSRAEKLSSNRAVLLRLVREARPIYKWLALACVISLAVIACALAAPQILGDCIQLLYDFWAGSFTGESLTAALLPGCIALAVIYLLQGLMNWLKMFILNNAVSRYYSCGLRIKLSAKISRLPVSFADKTPVGQILDRMTEDVSIMGGSLHDIIDTLMVGFLQIIAIAVMMLLEDWRLSAAILADSSTESGIKIITTSASRHSVRNMMIKAPTIVTNEMKRSSGPWWASSEISMRSLTIRDMIVPVLLLSKYVSGSRSR